MEQMKQSNRDKIPGRKGTCNRQYPATLHQIRHTGHAGALSAVCPDFYRRCFGRQFCRRQRDGVDQPRHPDLRVSDRVRHRHLCRRQCIIGMKLGEGDLQTANDALRHRAGFRLRRLVDHRRDCLHRLAGPDHMDGRQ